MTRPTALTGEPLALDLVNTRPWLAGGPVDLIATPEALGDWLARQAERLPADVLRLSASATAGPVAPVPTAAAAVPTAASVDPDHGVPIHADGEALTEADVVAVHAVREHTAAALDAIRRGGLPPAAALDGLNAAQRAAPAIRELSWVDGTVTAVPRRTGPAGVRLAAWLAEAAVDLLASPAVARVRKCEADDCVLLFLPAHPRRRWCSTTRCGNRVRVARYYRRHRSG